MSIQTTNHRIVQILLDEGANLYCNGGVTNTAELLMKELNLTEKEAYQILSGCKILADRKYLIDAVIKNQD